MVGLRIRPILQKHLIGMDSFGEWASKQCVVYTLLIRGVIIYGAQIF